MERFEKENQKEKNQSPSTHKKKGTMPEHVDAINFILRFESVWNFFKTCIIAECENRWIVDGRIYKKEVKA